MRMKTFRAASMRDAMNQVKSTLGPEAVILGTRELPSGSVELTAALDPEPTPAPRAPAPRPEGSPEQGWFMPEPEVFNAMHQELREMRTEMARMRTERQLRTRSTEQWDRMMAELKDLGRVMGVRGPVDGAHDALMTRLIAGGVEATLARTLVEEVAGVPDPSHKTQAIAERIRRALSPAPAIWDRDRHAVAAFVGPTGVGKTTTIAKVAAQAALNRGMSVGLVAADMYRIAGVEQLKIYADLLGVPLAIASDRRELGQALNRFANKDLVLVDTAGGNPWADETLEKTDQLLAGLPCERHLCVSAGTPGADLGRIVERYGQSGLRSLVITKLDEARTLGGVLSTVWGTDHQIAHVTTGQQVPSDIESPNPARLSQSVLG